MACTMQLSHTRSAVAARRVARPTCVRVQAVARPSNTSSTQQSSSASLPLLAGVGVAAPFLLQVQNALATDGAFGILEGRTAALVHPIVMGSLFLATGYAGYLGWQWRRTRTIGEDIKALKAQLPKVAVAAGEAAAPAPPSPLDGQIAALEKERKELVSGGYRDKHYLWGALLLGGGTTIAIAGCINTWMRTGKLFPGPHLFAGAGIVALWALAAALVPSMQKGNEGARNAHIALNVLNLLLFAWQVPTGLEITGKVLQFTSWP